jgi:hypothetical protein
MLTRFPIKRFVHRLSLRLNPLLHFGFEMIESAALTESAVLATFKRSRISVLHRGTPTRIVSDSPWNPVRSRPRVSINIFLACRRNPLPTLPVPDPLDTSSGVTRRHLVNNAVLYQSGQIVLENPPSLQHLPGCATEWSVSSIAILMPSFCCVWSDGGDSH